MRCSIYELYRENIKDLLLDTKVQEVRFCETREAGVFLNGITEINITNLNEMNELIERAKI